MTTEQLVTRTRRAVALNQVFGATAFAVGLVVSSTQRSVLPDSYLFIAYPFILWVWLASVGLWKGTSFGLWSSVALQALAVLGYTDLQHSWLLELGGQVQFEIGRNAFDLHVGFGGRFGLWPWMSGSAQPTLWFDLIALFCFVFLLRSRWAEQSNAENSTTPGDPPIPTN